ncbi:MAG: hypothetical protein KGL43_22625 [Burkholderiales bacterium]|nr:hypothetical protein [Burkholderiales bacterium]MDE2395042.1 hypothetical protein [Burkholderiales bacterium]MDE2456392.1 hypothetical protein [Burkholderiales bacterium]
MSFTNRCALGALAAVASLVLGGCGGGTSSATIGGTLTGLGAGQTLQLLNGGDAITLNANGSFTFPTQVSSGNSYFVTIGTKSPSSLFCSVGAGSGTVDTAGDAVTSVSVACNSTATVSGTVSGLANGYSVSLTLTDLTTNVQSAANVAYTGNTLIPFSFPAPLSVGDQYQVLVSNQPAAPSGQTCVIQSGGSGTMTATGASPVGVAC